MAAKKTKSETTQTQENITETQENVTETQSKTTKTQENIIKVKILRTLRGSYGAFDRGKTYEISSRLAGQFIEGGAAEKC